MSQQIANRLHWLFQGPIGLQSSRRPPSTTVDPILIYAPSAETLTGSFALSPSGSQLAFVTAGMVPEQSRLWLRSVDGVAARPLAGTAGAAKPFWSPDEHALGFFAEGKLKTVDLRSGKIATIADATRGRGASWSADGRILFVPDLSSPIFAVDANGGGDASNRPR
jgi:hypothetical protein